MTYLDRLFAGGLLLALTFIPAAQAQDTSAEELLNARCASCHQSLPDGGGLTRISKARKTPEGWDMTIVRMMLVHGVQVNPEERALLVKHLADTQGIAPAETAAWRYILERQPNVVETPEEDDLAVMCARCHSYARIALQRRDSEDWLKLVHFHQGQYPTTEYQALARDRNWWEIASTELPEKLAQLYPYTTDAWTQWQDQDKASPAGAWRIIGQHPGKGRYTGTATITETGDADHYQVKTTLNYADGSKVDGEGSAILYSGFEWRGRLSQSDDTVLQVFALAEDGQSISGRWFLEDSDAIGSNMRMVRLGEGPMILSVEPPYLKRGETANIIVHGTGMQGDVELGEGIEIGKVLYSSAAAIALEVTATADAANGPRTVKAGETEAQGLLTVYDQIAAVKVEPDYAIARVGGNGGPLAPVPAQFDAVAYLSGADGEAGTDDDVRIGSFPATWSVVNANEIAAGMEDTKYAGNMQSDGLFMPAGAGPNPERRYATNNAGDLLVTANVTDGDNTIAGSARLIVTVQRWNDPPIR